MDGWRIGHAIRSVHRRPDKYISPRMPDPHIDLTYLERLYKGDRARIAQWIHIYLEEAPAQFQRLSDSLEKNDTERLASAAHDLRPQAHYVGAVRMLELLIAIGQRAREDSANACAGMVGELRSLGALVEDELKTVIAADDPAKEPV